MFFYQSFSVCHKMILCSAPTRPRPRPVVEYFLRICQFCRFWKFDGKFEPEPVYIRPCSVQTTGPFYLRGSGGLCGNSGLISVWCGENQWRKYFIFYQKYLGEDTSGGPARPRVLGDTWCWPPVVHVGRHCGLLQAGVFEKQLRKKPAVRAKNNKLTPELS